MVACGPYSVTTVKYSHNYKSIKDLPFAGTKFIKRLPQKKFNSIIFILEQSTEIKFPSSTFTRQRRKTNFECWLPFGAIRYFQITKEFENHLIANLTAIVLSFLENCEKFSILEFIFP